MAYGQPYKVTSSLSNTIDEEPCPVYKIGKYNVQVSYLKQEVTVSEPGRPERIDQSISLLDGVLSVDFSFIVEEVLRKCDPIEIGRGMCDNADVREHFIEALAERWSYDNIGDAERRKFLTKVGVTVNEVAVDTLADTMRKWEYEFCRRAYVDEHVSNINRTLRDLNVMVPQFEYDSKGARSEIPPILLQMRRLDERTVDDDGKSIPGPVAILGKAWEESRTYWRDEIGKLFPPPLAPMPVAYDPFAFMQEALADLRDKRSGSAGSEFVTVPQMALDLLLSKVDDIRGMKPPTPPADIPFEMHAAEKPAASDDDMPF